MRKNIFFACFLLIATVAFAQSKKIIKTPVRPHQTITHVIPVPAKPDEFEIRGNLKHLTDNETVTLVELMNQDSVLAKARIKNNQFILKGKLSEPFECLIKFSERESLEVLCLVYNNKITIIGDLDNKDSLFIKGRLASDRSTSFDSDYNATVVRLKDSWTNIQSTCSDSMLKADTAAQLKNLFNYVQANNNSLFSALLILASYPTLYEMNSNIDFVKLLSDSVKNSYYGRRLAGFIVNTQDSLPKVNTYRPNLQLTDTAGNHFSLDDYKGKWVLLDFWAGWCGPCKEQLPFLHAAHELFKDNKNFAIVAVSLDEDKDQWREATKKYSVSWRQSVALLKWDDPVVGIYHLTGIPANFLISPEGKIVARDLRGVKFICTLNEKLSSN